MHAAARPLFDALAARGDAPFLGYEDREVSARTVLDAIEHARREAESLPLALAPGDVVGLRGRHAAMRVVAPLAAWSLGLCAHMLSDREPDASVSGLLAASGARCVLTWREPGGWSLLPLSTRVGVELPAGTLLTTSGSAGKPKLVAHALEQHIASARGAAAFLGLRPDDRLLLSLPTYHAGGLGIVLRALLSGAVLCVPSAETPLAAALVRMRPTQVSLVATQLARLLDDAVTTAALRACRTVLLGGGPVPTTLRARALEAGVPLAVSYGATETSAFVTASRNPAILRRPQSAGRPLPGRDVRVDEDGRISVGGPTLCSGYLVDGVLQSALDAAGLWASGDLGRLEDGVLYVTGRRDRMFVSGGENVQPEEIEAVLQGLPGVIAAVVVPVAHAEFGARPVAFVAGEGLDAASLDAAVRAVLSGFKAPDVYYRLPEDAQRPMKPDLPTLGARASDPVAAARLDRL